MITHARDVQCDPERADVGAGFLSNQTEATPKSSEIQDQLINQVWLLLVWNERP